MKLSVKEMVVLATKGYKANDLAELAMFDEKKFNKEEILSLADNGYSLSDIKQLDDILSSADVSEESEKLETSVEKTAPQDGTVSTDTATDDIDYKALYEQEKQLREKIQHTNASKREGAEIDDRTDEDVAIDFVKNLIGG